ncbi:MAG: RrF2 family transcriptional regulator [Dehalococcoidales bacterium]|nr:RrF2 family transcriptional regulator [Dehalococcoidales bacterium]
MKLSTRARYGSRALLDIALRGNEEPVQLKEIAQREEISLQYLEHLITPLISAGIIRSQRGAKGGVMLAKPASEIKLSEIVNILEGTIDPVECIENPTVCERSNCCVTRDIWDEVKKAMDSVLENITLQNMVERYREKENPEPVMFNI